MDLYMISKAVDCKKQISKIAESPLYKEYIQTLIETTTEHSIKNRLIGPKFEEEQREYDRNAFLGIISMVNNTHEYPIFYVTKEVEDIISQMAYVLPDDFTLMREDLISDKGFVFLESSLETYNFWEIQAKRAIPEKIKCFFWDLAKLNSYDEAGKIENSGVVVVVDFDDLRETQATGAAMLENLASRGLHENSEEALIVIESMTTISDFLKRTGINYCMTDISEFTFGKEAMGGTTPAGVNQRRWYRALWGFLNSEIVTTRRPQYEDLPRPLRRRIEPESFPEISVITLRRKKLKGDREFEMEGEVNWTHRWVVNGHWRKQPCGPGRNKTRLVWIPAHIKGPEDKPLVIKEKVYNVAR